MAYQNVGTPRFYINELEWMASVGAIILPHPVLRTLPVTPTYISARDIEIPAVSHHPDLNYYFMALRHTRNSINATLSLIHI